MDDNRMLRDAMDACRRADLTAGDRETQALARALESDDSLRAAWERSLRFDDQVRARFGEVDVPDGLGDRILERVESEAEVEPAKKPVVARRRWLTRLVLGTTVAAALVLAFVLFQRGGGRLTRQQLVEQVVAWHQAADDASWAMELPPETHRKPSNVLVRGQGRWRRVGSNAMDDQAVAYDLSAANDGSAVLYVIRTRREIPLSRISLQRLSATGGWKIGAWRNDELVFVIVVRGNGPDPASFTYDRDIT